MQTLLFDVGEGVRDRILASDIISLNANLAKYREDIKAGRARKNRNRSSELNGKNETYAKLAIPEKSGMMNKKELKS